MGGGNDRTALAWQKAASIPGTEVLRQSDGALEVNQRHPEDQMWAKKEQIEIARTNGENVRGKVSHI